MHPYTVQLYLSRCEVQLRWRRATQRCGELLDRQLNIRSCRLCGHSYALFGVSGPIARELAIVGGCGALTDHPGLRKPLGRLKGGFHVTKQHILCDKLALGAKGGPGPHGSYDPWNSRSLEVMVPDAQSVLFASFEALTLRVIGIACFSESHHCVCHDLASSVTLDQNHVHHLV